MIHAVAFVLEEDATDDLSSSLAEAIANKVIEHFATIKADLVSAKNFLEANSIQQAATSIELTEAASQQSTTTTSLNSLITKLASYDSTKTTPSSWPSVPTIHPSTTTVLNTYDPMPPPITPASNNASSLLPVQSLFK